MSGQTVLLTGDLHRDGLEVLSRTCTVARADSLHHGDLSTLATDVDAVIARANVRLDRRFFEQATRLRVVGRFGVGLDNIDLAAARDHGVVVVNAPGANAGSVVEHALGCMLALARRLPEHDRRLRQGDWAVRDRIVGSELAGRVLGVVGFGEIGGRLGRACRRALGMEIVYHDAVARPDLEAELDARRLDLADLLATADVISLHVPFNAATRHLVDASALSKVKRGAVLLNLARGGVVDEVALCENLEDGRLAGAALDVFEEEPLPVTSPLLAVPNLILTPHAAGLNDEANSRVSVQVAQDVVAVLGGRRPRHPVPYPSAEAGLRGAPA